MLRSRKEILIKRKELLKSAKAFRKKYRRLFIIQFTILALIFLSMFVLCTRIVEMDFLYCFLLILPLMCMFAIVGYVFDIYLKKWESKRRIRAIIARNLKDIIEILDKTEGEKLFYSRLDEMVRENQKEKEKILYRLCAVLDPDSLTGEDAPLQAYIWAASPSGVPGGKDE
jgi:hypothetical protein